MILQMLSIKFLEEKSKPKLIKVVTSINGNIICTLNKNPDQI